jgi:hypothetical protein
MQIDEKDIANLFVNMVLEKKKLKKNTYLKKHLFHVSLLENKLKKFQAKI